MDYAGGDGTKIKSAGVFGERTVQSKFYQTKPVYAEKSEMGYQQIRQDLFATKKPAGAKYITQEFTRDRFAQEVTFDKEAVSKWVEKPLQSGKTAVIAKSERLDFKLKKSIGTKGLITDAKKLRYGEDIFGNRNFKPVGTWDTAANKVTTVEKTTKTIGGKVIKVSEYSKYQQSPFYKSYIKKLAKLEDLNRNWRTAPKMVGGPGVTQGPFTQYISQQDATTAAAIAKSNPEYYRTITTPGTQRILSSGEVIETPESIKIALTGRAEVLDKVLINTPKVEIKSSVVPQIKPILISQPALKPVLKPILESGLVLKPELKPALRPSLQPALRPELKPALKPVVRTVQKPALKPVLKPALQTQIQTQIETDIDTIDDGVIDDGGVITEPFIINPPKTEIPNVGFKSKEKLLEAFVVQVRRGGVFRTISKKPLPKGKALRLGSQRTLSTLAATFRLKRKGFTKERDVPFRLSSAFRRPRKAAEEKLTFIERKNLRIKRGTQEIPEILSIRGGKTGKRKKRRKSIW
jgi:hypothetical protein